VRKLRILHTEASCAWGGQEIRILEEAAGLIGRGHDVQLVVPAGATIAGEAKERGIPVHLASLDRRRPKSLLALLKIVRKLRPEVIVTHSSTDSWLVSVATRLIATKPVVVRTRHVSTAVKPGAPNRWLYGRVPARVVTTGETVRGQLIAGLGLDPSHVVSIPTGIDTMRFRVGDRISARRRLGLPDGPLVGVVATLRSWKGHRFLLKAMTDPALVRARLVIVGDGRRATALREEARDLGLDGRIVFAGHQNDVVPWLQALDVFALPSIANEGVSQALMQAMACEVPVIATDIGATGELVVDREAGLLVPPENPAALAQAIARLLEDRAFAARLAVAGRRRVEEKYTKDAMLDAMERLLTEVAGHGS